MPFQHKTKLTGKLAERGKARASEGVVLPKIKEGMLKDFGRDQDRRWDIVHPSELSHQERFCPRAVFLRITFGPVTSEKFDFIRENIFEEGNQIHAKWQARLRRYTSLWGNWQCLVCGEVIRSSLDPGPMTCSMADIDHIWEYHEVRLDAEAEALLCGHADGGLWEDRALVEFKSVGAGSVRIEAPTLYARHLVPHPNGGEILDLNGLWRDIDRPFMTHLNQGDIYLWIAHQRGLPFNKMAFVYECKWNQQVKEYVIDFSMERSQKLVKQAIVVKEAVQRGQEPACRFPGKCKECAPYDARAAKARPKRTVQVRRG